MRRIVRTCQATLHVLQQLRCTRLPEKSLRPSRNIPIKVAALRFGNSSSGTLRHGTLCIWAESSCRRSRPSTNSAWTTDSRVMMGAVPNLNWGSAEGKSSPSAQSKDDVIQRSMKLLKNRVLPEIDILGIRKFSRGRQSKTALLRHLQQRVLSAARVYRRK
jgi:hypothetical protein